jgi:hypothetical protein
MLRGADSPFKENFMDDSELKALYESIEDPDTRLGFLTGYMVGNSLSLEARQKLKDLLGV